MDVCCREPERWYHYANVHGIVVWQDMPSSFNLTGEEAQAQFRNELTAIVKAWIACHSTMSRRQLAW